MEENTKHILYTHRSFEKELVGTKVEFSWQKKLQVWIMLYFGF